MFVREREAVELGHKTQDFWEEFKNKLWIFQDFFIDFWDLKIFFQDF